MLSTKHVVLGLVIERPGYGYELQQRLDRRFAFLGLSDRAVYRMLDRLQRDGLIEPAYEKQAGRTSRGAPRLVYTATPAGHDEFGRWIAEPCEIAVVREEVHVKVVLSQAPNFPRVIELTEKLEQACLAAMRELQQASAPSLEELADPAFPWETAAVVLVDDAEAARLQSYIDWLQRVRTIVRRRMEPPARRPRMDATSP
ncbi:MAG TPA: PadR family transcriptional regulator [Conexibacter sp.]|nr:PadR family transcriptional regulator [Conexibacter sp.]